MECEFATINSNKEEIKEIFENTKTIAVVGCSPDESKASNMVARYLKNSGFKIIPVYPTEDEILGQKVYKSLEQIPFKVDMVDIFRKSQAITEIANEAIKRGDIHTFWTQLGLVNNEAAKKVKDSGIKVVQNKCTKIEHKAVFN